MQPAADGNEEVRGSAVAYLFRAGDWLGITRDNRGLNLPLREDGASWTKLRPVTLGIRVFGVAGVTPEAVVRGLHSRGFYVWRPGDPSRIPGTSQ